MKKIYPFLIFLLIFISLRVVHLSADPPDNLSPTSCGEYGDPGNYAFNARNKVIFGQWKIDDFNLMYLFPLPHLFTYLSFVLFGSGIWQMNCVPVFFSLLLLLALYFLSSKYFPEVRWLFFLLLLVNYPFGMYSRIANRIMPMTFFVILAIYFFLKAWENAKYFFLCSLFLCCSFFSKGKIIYFHVLVIPLSFLLILIQRKEFFKIKLNFRRLLYFISGATVGFIPWYFFLYLPHKILFARMSTINVEAMFPSRMSLALSNWLSRPPFSFYGSNILLSFLIFFYFFYLVLLLFKKTKISSIEIICSAWLIIGLAFNSLISYRPIRHYIEFTVPFLILVCIFIGRLISHFRFKIDLKNRIIPFSLLFLLVWVCLSSYSKPLLSFLKNMKIAPNLNEFLLFTLSLAMVFSILIFCILHFFLSSREIILPKKWAVLLVSVLLVVYSFQNIREYILQVQRPTFNLKTISRDLGKAFPQGVFCGLLGPSIGLENKNRVHSSWRNFTNDSPDFLKRKNVTHLFLATFNLEPNYYITHFPEEWKKAQFLARYRIWRSWFLLYEIKEVERGLPDTLSLEAEKMERDLGLPLFDPQASGRFSVYVASKKREMIGQEIIRANSPGKLKGKLFIKIKKFDQREPLLFLTVAKKGKVIYKKALSLPTRATQSSENYEPLPFDFFLPEPGEYELTIVCVENSVFYFDRIVWEDEAPPSEIPIK